MGGAAEAAVPVGQHPLVPLWPTKARRLWRRVRAHVRRADHVCSSWTSHFLRNAIGSLGQACFLWSPNLLWRRCRLRPGFPLTPGCRTGPLDARIGAGDRSGWCFSASGRVADSLQRALFLLCHQGKKRPAQGLRVQNGRAWAGAACAVKRLEWGSEFP